MKLKTKHWIYLLTGLLLLGFVGLWAFRKLNNNSEHLIEQRGGKQVGERIDSLNGVLVFYNGEVKNVTGRNKTADGYNLGLKYQCVEFVKRYYYEHLNHKMHESYGHAKDFFDKSLADGQKNKQRNLTQFTNPGRTKPKVDDLLIFDGTPFNEYGHVAIVSKVTNDKIEIIQQNPGPYSKSRESFSLIKKDGKWKMKDNRVLGWLRKE